MLNKLKVNIDHQVLKLTGKYSDDSHCPFMVYKTSFTYDSSKIDMRGLNINHFQNQFYSRKH